MFAMKPLLFGNLASTNELLCDTANGIDNSAQSDGIQFDDLNKLAEQDDFVQLQHRETVFVVRCPKGVRDVTTDAHFAGWKLTLSLDTQNPANAARAFDLVEPIISRYCPCFAIRTDGAEITIFLEELGELVCTPEDAEKMLREIDHVFSENQIASGGKPNSGAKTISPYGSIRNDKCIQDDGVIDVISASRIGRNFNPVNNPNPFYTLLSEDTPPFDPMEHLLAFEMHPFLGAMSKDNLFCYTALSYVREYVFLDTMNEAAQQRFIFQCCVEQPINLDTSVFMEPYQDNPEVRLAVKYAATLVTMRRAGDVAFHEYIKSAKLSDHYPYDNSFKQFLKALEDYSHQEVRHDYRDNALISLTDVLHNDAQKVVAGLSENELVEVIQKGHFFHSLAALGILRKKYMGEPEKYKEVLLTYKTVAAAQLEYARQMSLQAADKSELYYFKVAVSDAANCVEIDNGTFVRCLLKYRSHETLKELSQNGNSLATFALARIYARDIKRRGDFSLFDNFKIVPIDHAVARDYLAKLQTNALHSREVVSLAEKLRLK